MARILRSAFCFLSFAVALGGLLPPPNQANAAAIVGKSESVEQIQPSTERKSSTDAKADYRRPATIPHPQDNPYTVQKVVLGKRLFYDTRLSQSNALSCASCHNPAFGWSDGQKTAVGHGMRRLKRRSPTIHNLAWDERFMWDGRFRSLEEQALGPITSPEEMNMDRADLVARVIGIEGYKALFDQAFPGESVTPETIAKALATYERTLVSGIAPFDRWVNGEETAISEAAKRGFELFNGKARCAKCHSGWNFTDGSFHDIGLPGDDLGRGRFFPNAVKMQHAFKTPGLRELDRRGPFMHDGSVESRAEVIDHYDEGGVNRPSRSDLIGPLTLSDQEKADLLAFLSTLSSNQTFVRLPTLPK